MLTSLLAITLYARRNPFSFIKDKMKEESQPQNIKQINLGYNYFSYKRFLIKIGYNKYSVPKKL